MVGAISAFIEGMFIGEALIIIMLRIIYPMRILFGDGIRWGDLRRKNLHKSILKIYNSIIIHNLLVAVIEITIAIIAYFIRYKTGITKINSIVFAVTLIVMASIRVYTYLSKIYATTLMTEILCCGLKLNRFTRNKQDKGLMMEYMDILYNASKVQGKHDKKGIERVKDKLGNLESLLKNMI